MIPANELYIALSLAIAAASAPGSNETPLPGVGMSGLAHICFDFWPGDSLRIVGCNGRRLAVTYLKAPGLPGTGKFLMPIEKAAEALLAFAPPPNAAGDTVTLTMLGLDQMILMGNTGNVLAVDGAKALYPEYHLLLEGDMLPTSGAVYDVGTLKWVLDHAAAVADGAICVQIRAHGPTTYRPQLRAGFTAIRDVVIAVKPFKLVS